MRADEINSLSYVHVLLKQHNLKSFDICVMIINHPKYVELPDDRKKEWEVVYEASLQLKIDAK